MTFGRMDGKSIVYQEDLNTEDGYETSRTGVVCNYVELAQTHTNESAFDEREPCCRTATGCIITGKTQS